MLLYMKSYRVDGTARRYMVGGTCDFSVSPSTRIWIWVWELGLGLDNRIEDGYTRVYFDADAPISKFRFKPSSNQQLYID